MDGVLMLSEIHQLGLQQHNPLQQADQWFDLFTESERETLGTRPSRCGEIRPPPAHEQEPALLERMVNNPDFRAAITLLGYPEINGRDR